MKLLLSLQNNIIQYTAPLFSEALVLSSTSDLASPE